MTDEVFEDVIDDAAVKKSKPAVNNKKSVILNENTLGELEKLIGTWVGEGVNVIAVPVESSTGKFRVIAQDFDETLTFAPLADGVANRKIGETQIIAGLHYEQVVNDKQGNNLHFENGLWLVLETTDGVRRIVRQTSVPHGNVFIAGGQVIGTFPVSPKIDDTESSLPPEFADLPIDSGYLKPYGDAQAANTVDIIHPNTNLSKHNDGIDIEETTVYSLTTENNKDDPFSFGSISNIPFFDAPEKGSKKDINTFIETPKLSSIFWVNTVKAEDGSSSFELQYTQNTTLKFFKSPKNPNDLIEWPHIDVATLKKQP
ncbi:MAG: hypothetical protein HRU20_26295 [Pseudomonadales bacterium]|nr:hypothetical protein [Pseudomonadales bacterium]